MVEASRKHAPFDMRWPSARQDRASAVSTAAPLRTEEVAEALDDAGAAEIKLMPRRDLGVRAGRAVRRVDAAPVSALPVTRRAVAAFDHAGLFMAPLDRPGARSAAAKTHERPAIRRGRGRVAPTDRHKSGLHRYCSGCAKETEHVAWTADGRGSIPSIRWPSTKPGIGTTICLTCGQLRAASFQPSPPAWSSWPRKPTATRSVAVAADSTDTTDEWVSETPAEDEGMPARREPRRPRKSGTRLRRARAVAQ